jgi:SAM-dependent methyltransferase
VILGDVTRAALPESFFGSCVANCSLEHVPRIDLALLNIRRSLRPGGVAYLFVPNRDWARHFLSYRALESLGFHGGAELLRSSIDAFFAHHHLYDADGWRDVVSAAGLEIDSMDPVLSTGTTVAFETLLLPSLAGWLNKHLTTRWTNFPRIRRLMARPAHSIVSGLVRLGGAAPTAEFLVVARRPLA